MTDRPCIYKMERARARWTRVHKLLAAVRDRIDDPVFDKTLHESGHVVYHEHGMDMLVQCERKHAKYIIVVTEHATKLHELTGSNLRDMVSRLFWKTIGDEMLELCDVFQPVNKSAWWETTEGRHPRIVVEGVAPVHGKFRIPVDVEIAPLVVKLNMAGIRTKYSCQGDPGKPLSAYVSIEPEDDNEKARAVIFAYWHDKYVYHSDRHNAYYMSETDAGKQRFRHLGEEPFDGEEPVHRPDAKEATNV